MKEIIIALISGLGGVIITQIFNYFKQTKEHKKELVSLIIETQNLLNHSDNTRYKEIGNNLIIRYEQLLSVCNNCFNKNFYNIANSTYQKAKIIIEYIINQPRKVFMLDEINFVNNDAYMELEKIRQELTNS